MKENNVITTTYQKPEKRWIVAKLKNNTFDINERTLHDNYDSAIKEAHSIVSGHNGDFHVLVFESVYYTGKKSINFYGMEFERNDNGDMV